MDENPYRSPQVPPVHVPHAPQKERRPHYGLVAFGLAGAGAWGVLAVIAYRAISEMHYPVAPATLAKITLPILAGVVSSIAVIGWAFRRRKAIP
jgi:hypothetical protein